MEKGFTIPVLDHGFVRYIDHFGSDLRICESARISYLSPSKGDESDKKLLFFLYKHLHSSPFEQCNATFNIKMPIMCMREFVRHRTFRLNEMSGRYVQLPAEFYNPKEWRKQDNKNKQGSLVNKDWNTLDDFGNQHSWNKEFSRHLETHCKNSYELYEKMIGWGIAREMARMVLPVNIYTEIYVNCDIRNLMHFFKLRLALNAQWEIRQVAQAMFDIFEKLYPWCAEAYKKFTWELKELE